MNRFSEEEEEDEYDNEQSFPTEYDNEEEEEEEDSDDDEVENLKELSFEQRLQLLKKQQSQKRRERHAKEMDRVRKQKIKNDTSELPTNVMRAQTVGDGGVGVGEPKKKKNKNAPRELSSKAKVPKVVNVVGKYQTMGKIKSRDPRFDDLSSATAGQLKENQTLKNSLNRKYGFVREMQQQEIEEYKAALKNRDLDYNVKRDIQRKMTRLISKSKSFEHDQLIDKVKHDFYENEKKLVAETGKKPYFLKDSELKQLVLKRKRDEMTGAQRDKHIQRQRKKQKSRQHTMMPTTSGNRGTH